MTLNTEKLIFISLTDSAGGAEQILLMSSKVHQSQLIFLKKAASSALIIDDSSTKVKFLNRQSLQLGFLLLIKELYQYRAGYTIVSSHSYLNAFLGILKRAGYLKSKLITRESTSVFLRFTGLKKLSYKLVYILGYPGINLLICQTREMRTQLLENLPFLKQNQVIVEKNPIDLHLVQEKSLLFIDDPILRENYICSAGRLMTLKGFDILIQAFSQIKDTQPGLKLIILGEGEERNALENLIERLGLQGKVVLKGFVNNPFPYFRYAQVCVISSIREGFPNVLLQMMALNKSVVSTLCADGIGDFDSVIKVKVDNVNELAGAIESQLIQPETDLENKNVQFISSRSPRNFISSVLSQLPD
jgi:glycosyltransferase involved in cell wall biosynthesis